MRATRLAGICCLILLPAALAAIDYDVVALIVAAKGCVAATLRCICEAMGLHIRTRKELNYIGFEATSIRDFRSRESHQQE